MADDQGGNTTVELFIRIGLLVVTGLVVATVFGDDLLVLVGRSGQAPVVNATMLSTPLSTPVASPPATPAR